MLVLFISSVSGSIPNCWWPFLRRFIDGGQCHNSQNISASHSLSSSLIWFSKIWASYRYGLRLGDDPDFFFRLPFVRRHSVVLTYYSPASTGVRGIIDWLFDDYNYGTVRDWWHQRPPSSYGGGADHRPPSRHLWVYYTEDDLSDISALITAIKEEVNKLWAIMRISHVQSTFVF